MVAYCDKCGTELDPSQARHQTFRMEHADPDVESLEGRLCSDCFWTFAEWLNTNDVEAEA